jgi:hypothetical protein
MHQEIPVVGGGVKWGAIDLNLLAVCGLLANVLASASRQSVTP